VATEDWRLDTLDDNRQMMHDYFVELQDRYQD
jgi:hypothetical protein